jgi:hypothetical protein
MTQIKNILGNLICVLVQCKPGIYSFRWRLENVDRIFGVKSKLGNWDRNVLYHDFSAQSGSAKYGTEIDGSK